MLKCCWKREIETEMLYNFSRGVEVQCTYVLDVHWMTLMRDLHVKHCQDFIEKAYFQPLVGTLNVELP